MQLKTFFQTMSDGTEIWVNRWMPDDGVEIKGIVQLHHGLSEHSMRYDRFGSVLAENGYVLNAHDMRGHGKTAQTAEAKGTGKFGVLAKKDGFNRVIEDLNEIILKLKEDYPDKKTILFAHSFGSFVSQGYIEKYAQNIDDCILAGTSGPNPLAKTGKIITSIVGLFKGKKNRSSFVEKVAFGSYNSRIENPQSPNAWCCSNPAAIALFENDSWCGIPLSISFFHDMTSGLCQIHKKSNMKKIPLDLPLLFIYGTEDPVGNYGESIKNLISIYKANGMKNITEIPYEGCRHELLNEDIKETVEKDVLDWISKN